MDKRDLYEQDVPMKHIHRLEAVNQVLPECYEIETIYDHEDGETIAVLHKGGEPAARTASKDNSGSAIVDAIHLAVVDSYGDTVVPENEPPLKQNNGNGSETQHAQTA